MSSKSLCIGIDIMKQELNQYDLACEILEKTNDGNKLSRFDLNMVQNLVNGDLNEKGFEYMKSLHQKVTEGKYKIPFFHGIENFIQDQEGYVYYKGRHVEHYSFRDYNEEEIALRDLERYCKLLEKYGIKPDGASIWYESEFVMLEKEGSIKFDVFLFKIKYRQLRRQVIRSMNKVIRKIRGKKFN